MNYKLPFKDIFKAATDANTFSQGMALFHARAVSGVSADFCNKDSREAQTCVTASVRDGNYVYAPVLYFGQTRGFFSCGCNCRASAVWRGACKHAVATLFYLQRFDAFVFDKGHEKRITGNLTKLFEASLIKDIQKTLETGEVTLEPSLAFLDKTAALALRIGMGRMYVLKNIDKFLDDVECERTVEYGKMLAFAHKLSAFDQRSRRLVELLTAQKRVEREVYDKDRLYHGYGSSGYLSRANGYTLLRGSFDTFFEIYRGTSLTVGVRGGTDRAVLFSEGTYDPGFCVEEADGGICLKNQEQDQGQPDPGRSAHFYDGAKYAYVLEDGALYRMEKDAARAVEPVKKAISDTPSRQLIFEGDQREAFLSYLYPALKRHGAIRQSADIAYIDKIFMPSARMYFDSEDNRVTCRLVFDYGGRAVNPNDQNPGAGFRNIAEEARITALLTEYGFLRENDVFALRDEERIFDFYMDGIEPARAAAEVYATESFDRRAFKKKPNARLGVRIAGNLLAFEIDSDYTLAELAEALVSYTAKKRYHRLKDGRFVNLHDEGIAEIEDLIAAADISKRDCAGNRSAFTMPLYRAAMFKRSPGGALDMDEGVDRLCAELSRYNADNAAGLDQNDQSGVPESLAHILRGYQKTGFAWLRMLAHHGFGGILADDMGLGKTLQIIALILYYKENRRSPGLGDGLPKESIVVTPASLIYNWEKEIRRYAPSLTVTVLAGLPQARKELLDSAGADVYITTYDLLKRDIENYAGRRFLFCVADEAQYIKNAGTQNASAVKRIDAAARFALTGTPIENALSELWSIFDFSMHGFLYSASKFAKLYETPIVKRDDKERADHLKRQIAPFVMRRLKSQVLKELPEKIETTLFAEMTEHQKKLYSANLLTARAEFESAVTAEGFDGSRIKILALLTRLRQLCCHPQLFLENYKHGSGKLELCVETIKTSLSGGHRALIFSQFTSMLDIIKRELDKEGISFFYLDGQTPSKQRLAMADDFNGGQRQTFLISLKAGGTGLNLTGADVVIHYDPWWNPAVMQQAADRAHRIGQQRAVQVINLVARNTIEEKILDLQEKKRNLVDSVISEGSSFINKMTKEEIRELFAD